MFICALPNGQYVNRTALNCATANYAAVDCAVTN